MTNDPSTYSPERLVQSLSAIAAEHERRGTLFAGLIRRIERRLRNNQGLTKAQLTAAAKLGALETEGGRSDESEQIGALHDDLWFTAEVLLGNYVQGPNGEWLSLLDRELLLAREAAGVPVVAVAEPVADPVAEAVAIARSANIQSLDQILWTKPARTEREAKIRAALLAEASRKCAMHWLCSTFMVSYYFQQIGFRGRELERPSAGRGAADHLAEDARAAFQAAHDAAKALEEIKGAQKRQDTLRRAIDAAEGRSVESDDEDDDAD